MDERLLATFERTAGGQIVDLATSSGELIYLRRGGSRAWPAPAGGGADFAGALRLVGWQVPARASARAA